MMALPFLAIGLSVLGTLSAANSQKQQAEASAQASLYNAQIAQRDADIARQQAAADAEMQATDARRRIATMQAGFAAGGAVSGSALDVLADSATQAEKDNQTIKYKGELRAMGYESTAALDRFSAGNARVRGQDAFTSTLFSGFGSVGSKFIGGGGTGYSIAGGSLGTSGAAAP